MLSLVTEDMYGLYTHKTISNYRCYDGLFSDTLRYLHVLYVLLPHKTIVNEGDNVYNMNVEVL